MERFINASVYIAIARTDSGVSVMEFLTRARLDPEVDFAGWKPVEGWFEREVKPEYIEAELAELVREQGLVWSSWRLLNDVETQNYLNADRTFRNAWKHDLTVDMPKAREIHRNNLRSQRTPLLVSLDLEFMRAIEAGNTAMQVDIAMQKQAMRDVTAKPEIEAAQTPEHLKAITL